jgi:integrase
MATSSARNGLDADLLAPSEIEALMRACSHRAPTGVRNRALIALCWRCGLRISEALALRPKDIDPATAVVIVQRGKGGKRRVVGIDAGTLALVDRIYPSHRAAFRSSHRSNSLTGMSLRRPIRTVRNSWTTSE